jgi:hypothetical protein
MRSSAAELAVPSERARAAAACRRPSLSSRLAINCWLHTGAGGHSLSINNNLYRNRPI